MENLEKICIEKSKVRVLYFDTAKYCVRDDFCQYQERKEVGTEDTTLTVGIKAIYPGCIYDGGVVNVNRMIVGKGKYLYVPRMITTNGRPKKKTNQPNINTNIDPDHSEGGGK
jgi:hypothetical protein